MRRNIMGWFLVSALGLGCGAATPPGGTTPVESPEERAELDRLQREAEERDAEMRELRSRLALARAEADDLRTREPDPPARRETVRIRTEGSLEYFDDEGAQWDEPASELPERAPRRSERRNERRPVLRLYGSPQTPLPEAMLRAPEIPSAGTVPAGVAASMAPPIAPIPMAAARVNPNAADAAYASVAPIPLAPARTRPQADGATSLYRSALGDLRGRRYGQALAGFDRILGENGSHRLAPSARYWRAEVLYIQRRYRDALAGFQAYLRQHANGAKAPDALLKVSLCRRRMGDRAGARRALEQLRRDYPRSIAARTAMREDAS